MTAADVRYVLDRLDMDHVRECALLARGAWYATGYPLGLARPFEVCYQPGDGTHYALLFVPLDRRLPVIGAPGGGTGGFPPSHGWGGVLKDPPDRLLAYWIQHGRGLQFAHDQYLDPSWIEQHFPAPGASVVALAVLLNLVSTGSEEWIDGYLNRLPEEVA